MFKRSVLTLFLAVSATALTATAPVLAKDKKEEAKSGGAPSGKPSKGVQKLFQEIQTMATAKDWAGVKGKLAEAETVSGRNSFDDYFINQYRYNAGIELKDNAMLVAGLEYMAKSDYTAADQKPKILRNLLSLAEQAKDHTKARAYADQYLQLVPDDQNVQLYIIEQMIKAKDFAGADAKLLQIIKASEAAGKPAEEFVYIRLAGARQMSKSPTLPESLYMLVQKYPSARNWNFLLEDFQTRSGYTGRAGIDLFRLMSATGALTTAGSVIDAAQTALDAGVPGDAKSFIEKAKASGLLADRAGDTALVLKTAQTAISAEEPAAKQEAAAATGDRLASVGQLYLSLGNYAKANDVFAKAISKGVRNKNETSLRHGIAQLMSGDAASAKTTFGSVSGDQKISELAKLWALYADKKI